MRPPRGPAGWGRPSPCPGRLRPPGRREAAWDAGTRVGAAVRLGTRDVGSPALSRRKGPGTRATGGLGPRLEGVDARSFFSSSQSFVELAVAAKLSGVSHWFAVGTTKVVVLGAACVNN